MTKQITKPPIGLVPRIIGERNRLIDVINAINRYQDAHLSVPYEWYDEYAYLTKRIRDF